MIRLTVDLVLNDCASLHDEQDALQNRNIIQRITGHRDEIGEFALVNGAGGLSGAEQ